LLHRIRPLFVLLALGTAFAGRASAIPEGLQPYELSVTIGETTYSLDDLPTVYLHSDTGGSYFLDADQNLLNGIQALVTPDFSILWSSSFDYDPLVTNNLTILNFLGVPLTVDITATSPVVPQGPSTILGGSVGLTLTNNGGGPASATASTSSGISIYTAMIDGLPVGNPVTTLLDDPYTLTEPLFLGTETASADFGIPFPGSAISGPAVSSTIGIRIRFILSPGDSLGVTSVFYVEADAPEPALIGVGALLAGLVLVRRRAA
jgi:hypothetical protein